MQSSRKRQHDDRWDARLFQGRRARVGSRSGREDVVDQKSRLAKRHRRTDRSFKRMLSLFATKGGEILIVVRFRKTFDQTPSGEPDERTGKHL